jgi:hypothetical protein
MGEAVISMICVLLSGRTSSYHGNLPRCQTYFDLGERNEFLTELIEFQGLKSHLFLTKNFETLRAISKGNTFRTLILVHCS